MVLLASLADGLTDREIGRLLDPVVPVSTDAVRKRVLKLRAKLGATSRAHAVALAFRLGHLTTPPLPPPRKDRS